MSENHDSMLLYKQKGWAHYFLIRMITNNLELKNRSSGAKNITIDEHERI